MTSRTPNPAGTPGRRRSSQARWLASATVLLALATSAFAAGSSGAASSPVTVSIDVPSAISLTNNCTANSAWNLGIVLPNSPATTDTGSGVCSFSWISGNDSAMLRVGQADGTGAAMGASPTVASRTYDYGDRSSTVVAFDATRSMAVTLDGYIRRTTDGGQTWPYQQSVNGGNDLNAVAVDRNDGTAGTWYVGGMNRSLFKTTTGQAGTPTWSNISANLASAGWPATVGVRALDVYRNAGATTIVVAAGERGWVARSADGGATWGTAYQVGNVNYDFEAISAVPNSNTVYLTGCNGMFRTTTDATAAGGWATLSSSCLYGVAAGDATHVYYSGQDNVGIYDGSSFTTALSVFDTYYHLVTVSPTNTNVAWVAGDQGVIQATTNGGGSWTRQDSGTGDDLYGIAARNTTGVTAVGAERIGVYSTTGGTTWNIASQVANKWDFASIAVAPDNGRLQVRAGASGTIQRSTDSGATWTTSANADTHTLFAVSLADDTYGWAVGTGGTILRTVDGGQSWSVQSSTAGQFLDGVRAIDRYTAIAVGSGGAILRTTNGGTTWTTIPSGVTYTLRAVATRDGTNVVVSGDRGTILRSTNGGATFTAAASVPNSSAVFDVSAGTATTFFAVAGWQNVYRSTDAGLNWSPLGGTVSTDELTVAAVDANVVYVTGTSVLQKTSDGGATWTSVPFAWTTGVVWSTWADANTVIGVGGANLSFTAVPNGSPTAQVSDYAAGANWGSASTTSTFGMCLQAVDLATTTVNGPTWTRDTSNTSGRCEALDTDPWVAIPTTMSKVATTPAGQLGRADFVFGVRPAANQSPSTYRASVVVEALAPAV